MHILEMFKADKPVVSCEIFPPRQGYPLDTIFETINGLKELQPAFISVTYGAGGSTANNSLEIAGRISRDYDITALAHFTCVGMNKLEIDQMLDRLQAVGVSNILALRGDPPAGQIDFKPAVGGYVYAAELVTHIKADGRFGIAAAAYPEGHMECSDRRLDLEYLAQKVRRGVDFLITQLFFDNQFFYDFREQALQAGIDCPIATGIMPVLEAKQIKRIVGLCGVAIPRTLTNIIEKYGYDNASMEQAGIEYACRQIDDLLAHGVKGIHMYTMNRPVSTRKILTCAGLR